MADALRDEERPRSQVDQSRSDGLTGIIGHVGHGGFDDLAAIDPLGLANFKLIPVSLTPFGRDIVDLDQARRFGYASQVAMPADPSRRGT